MKYILMLMESYRAKVIAVAGIGLMLLFAISVMLVGSALENRLQDQVRRMLSEQGLERIDVSVSGRDVMLKGLVSSEIARAALIQHTSNIQGVRKAIDQMVISPLRLSNLTIQELPHQILLEGELPTELMVEQLMDNIQQYYPDKTINNAINTTLEVTSPVWLSWVEVELLKIIEVIDGLNLTISERQMSVSGLVDSADQYQKSLSALHNSLTNIDIRLMNHIGIRPNDESIGADLNSVNAIDDAPSYDQIELVEIPSEQEVDSDIVINSTETQDNPDIPSLTQCQEMFNNLLSNHRIVFSSGSTKLSVENSTTIENIRLIMEKCPTYWFEIGGHTDSAGSQQSNQILSQKRAEAVRNALIDAGVLKDRVTAIGYGELYPVASNETRSGQAENRRIDFIVKLK